MVQYLLLYDVDELGMYVIEYVIDEILYSIILQQNEDELEHDIIAKTDIAQHHELDEVDDDDIIKIVNDTELIDNDMMAELEE